MTYFGVSPSWERVRVILVGESTSSRLDTDTVAKDKDVDGSHPCQIWGRSYNGVGKMEIVDASSGKVEIYRVFGKGVR